MKYLKIKPFKELQTVEVDSGSDSDRIEIIEDASAAKASSKRTSDNDHDDYASEIKKIKVEPTNDNHNVVRDEKLSTIQVLGHDLLYKQYMGSVHFKTSSVLELLSAKMPYQQSSKLESVVDKSKSANDNKRELISWNILKFLLNGGLVDISIREAFLQIGNSNDNASNEASVIFLNGNKIKFKVKNGSVYLEVATAFASLGKFSEALTGDWSNVDTVLANAQVSLKAAFKRKPTGEGSISAYLNRDFITFKAFSLLCNGEPFQHVIGKLNDTIDVIKTEVKKICTEFQQTVNMILRMSCIVPVDSGTEDDSSCSGHKEIRHGDISVYSRCCAKSHKFSIAEQDIKYVRRNKKIYLELHAAFALIGRLYAIRCSDYKKADSLLLQKPEDVRQFYLFEKGSKGSRTHISLDGFITLLRSGYDVSCNEDILSSFVHLRKVYQVTRRESCEEFETIDLSSSELESDDTKEGVKEASSGQESEGGAVSPPQPRKRMVSFNDYDSDDDSSMELQSKNIHDFVELMGVQIPVLISNDTIYVERSAVMKMADNSLQFALKNMDTIILDKDVLDNALVTHGRYKVFLSVIALQKLLESDQLEDLGARESVLAEISEILNNFVSEKSQPLHLKSFGEILYKQSNGTIYLDSQKLLRLAGFTQAYFNQPPAKANLFLCRLLSDRGLNTKNCFYKNGKSKYAFMSLSACSVLLRSDIGALKDNAKSLELIEQIFAALGEQNIIRQSIESQEMSIKILDEYPAIKYKILDGKLFLHRKSSFECLELESSVLNNKKGYTSLNNILKQAGYDIDKCYLESRQQKYCYIACDALIELLQSQNPMIVCLSNKDRFLAGLIKILQNAAIAVVTTTTSSDDFHVLNLDDHDPIEILINNGQLYMCKETVFQISGLLEQVALMGERHDDPMSVLEERGVDMTTAFVTRARGDNTRVWISLHCLYLMIYHAICEINVNKVLWRDILSAVSLYQPRIKVKSKLMEFKGKLIGKLESFFVEHSSSVIEESNGNTDSEIKLTHSSELDMNKEISLPVRNRYLINERLSNDQIVPGSDVDPNSPHPSSTLHSPANSCFPSPTESCQESWSNRSSIEGCPISIERFNILKRDIVNETDGDDDVFIGDWRLDMMEECYIKLSVKSGYGASRKNSFLNPDFAAILRYCLIITPDSVTLTINGKNVAPAALDKLFQRTQQEGTLSLLVQLISLRPCFGSFSPELVETVSQSLVRQDVPSELQNIVIDHNFIGSSSCGRTYAGTVRHAQCLVLAEDRVSDVCKHCRDLNKLTINRSVLTSNTGMQEKCQKSVWQLATTSSDGCSFVCPQVQSFNTSLPHAFDGREQATTIVSHQVEIKNDLDVQVHLSDRAIKTTFAEFQQNRQLGPLLDWVASLRLCVGYPNKQLVSQAQYIMDNMTMMTHDSKKLFKHLAVDTKFEYKMSTGDHVTGSIRSAGCSTVAEINSDICHSCRALQEPMEFLSG